MSDIIICGDTFPTKVNMDDFEKGNIKLILQPSLLDFFKESDFRIANLEGCYIDEGRPISKSGPNLKASVASFAGFDGIGFNLVGLANNHILDYGPEGLFSTIKLLNRSHIGWCGAGKNIEEAKKPFITIVNGKRIAVMAVAEYEFTIATDSTAGAACFDDLETPDYVSDIKKKVDYLIFLYHGGKEYYPYPSPYVQKRCRKIVDKGADLVITQHSHCVGCMEYYHGGTIVYGQGNFLLSLGDDNEFKKSGLILTLDSNNFAVRYKVVIKDGIGVRFAGSEESSRILAGFYKRSEEIKKTGFVETVYRRFADNMLEAYLRQSLGRVAGFLEKMKVLRYVPRLFEKENIINILNTVRCEAHRDLYIQGLVNCCNCNATTELSEKPS